MIKKHILFLTYYYPPCNATGANRPASFTKNFIANGYRVTVVTRHWSGNEKKWSDQIASNPSPEKIIKKGDLTVHSLPFKQYQYRRLSAVNTAFEYLSGNFNFELNYSQFEPYIEELLRNDRYDYILTSVPPMTVLKTASKISSKFGIPLILDIRDFLNNTVLRKVPLRKPAFIMEHICTVQYFKNWIRNSIATVTASPAITEFINEKFEAKAITLTNGFNLDLLQINEPEFEEEMNISVLGSLNADANLTEMKKMFQLIFLRPPYPKIKFNFIGLTLNPTIAAEFERLIPAKHLLITDRMPQQEAHKFGSKSHILMLAGYDGWKGAFTTKVFEYLGLRKPILLLPGDHDVIENLLIETRAGFSPHTAEEAWAIITDWYTEWQKKGFLTFKVELDSIIKYSRENQFQKLIDIL